MKLITISSKQGQRMRTDESTVDWRSRVCRSNTHRPMEMNQELWNLRDRRQAEHIRIMHTCVGSYDGEFIFCYCNRAIWGEHCVCATNNNNNRLKVNERESK